MSNRLHLSQNPYLLQHKDNPVHWQEWGAEAWAQSERENKPVFLSIGYSTCHWCHVMAHESFEVQETADVLNAHFVNIKLDREEKPDIDDLFMTATQLATGHGGWPLSIFLTPDKKPIYAGTYFPKEGRQGVPSFVTILNALASAWRDEESEVRSKANEFAQGLESVLEKGVAPVSTQIDPGLLDQAIQHFHSDFDYENGGFGSHPKFPPHAIIEFLIRYAQVRHQLVGDAAVIENLTGEASMMAFQTLEEMAKGGLRDHVRGGFHRYTVDEEWHLPHFEKMLYDNAQMIRNYALAAKAVDEPELSAFFQEVVDQTVEFVKRELMTDDGLFMSALDADSDGEEGTYYVWGWNELESVLGSQLGEIAALYGLNERGNFSDEATGIPIPKNILHLQKVAARPPALDGLVSIADARVRPETDYKCILGGNGLMISALASAGYIDLAQHCATRWLGYMNGDIPHQVVNGVAFGNAYLDDLAYFIDGILDLYSATNDEHWRVQAEKLSGRMTELFASEQGGFTFTSAEHELVYSRTIPAMDNAMPSPNGVAVGVLRRLGNQEAALRHLTAIYGWAQRLPGASSTILLECLEQLLLAEGNLRIEGETHQPRADIEFDPREVFVGEDGFGYSNLKIRIPKGMHINSHSPSAHWLTPTVVRIDGVYGEAGFPDTENDRYYGEVEIQLRLKAKTRTDEFELSIVYQLCTETECYLAQEARFAGVLITPES